MAKGRHVQVRLSPDEVSLLLLGLAALAAEDDFTRSVQPSQSHQAVAAVTRLQAIEMLRDVLSEAG